MGSSTLPFRFFKIRQAQLGNGEGVRPGTFANELAKYLKSRKVNP